MWKMHFLEKTVSVVPLFLLLSFPSFFQITPTDASTNATLYVSPSSVTGAGLGQNVSVQVKIYQAFNFAGYTFNLRFNASLLRCVGASSGSVFPAPSTHTIAVANNTAGTIYVTSDPGDVNGDGIVNLQDLVLFARAYGSTPDDPRWNPQADVNRDGIVNLQDLVLLALNYNRLNTPNPTGSGTLLTTTFNATFAAPYMQQPATCPLEILNSTIYGTGNPPQIIPSTSTNGTYYSPNLPPNQINLTLSTDKASCAFNENITVSGTLTADGYSVPDALVALEIKDPNGIVIGLRTLTTSTFSAPYPVQIMSVTPCTSDGTPNNNFNAGTDIAYFSVVVNSSGPFSNAAIWVNPYDSSNASLGATSFQESLTPGINQPVILGIPLDYNATSGTATVYASVLTGYVDSGGVPLSFETQTTFGITSNVTGTPALMSQPPNGTYKTILKIHWGPSSAGNYTIYAATEYYGIYATKNKQIQVTYKS
jgi:hypothetical protein